MEKRQSAEKVKKGISHELIYSEQLRLVVEGMPIALLTVLVNGAILAAVQWGEVANGVIVAWYAGVLGVALVRFLLYWLYRREPEQERDPIAWGNRFFFGTVLSGVSWGAAGYFLFPEGNHVHQVFLAFVLAGMISGAMTTLAPINLYFQTFAMLTVLPLCLQFIQHGDTIGLAMAAMTLLFLLMVSLSAVRVHRTILTSLHLRHERERSDEALAEADEQNRLLLESAAEGIFGVDINGVTTFVNPAAAVILGYRADELVGRPMHKLIHHHRVDGEPYPVEECPMSDTLRHGRNHFVDNEVLWHKEGRAIPVEYNSTPILKNGVVVGAVITFSDITLRREAESKLEYQAFFDSLTALANRRLLLDRLELSIASARHHGHMGALLFFDLDHFKNINDSLGHTTGDELLRSVAARLKRVVRAEDTVARMGGDEFVILLPDLEHDPEATAKMAQELADKARQVVSEPYRVLGHELHITPSIGIALFPMGTEGADDLLKQADTAMYRAKEMGRDTIQFFLPSMQLAAEERLALYNDLRHAVTRNELTLHYQPQYDTAGRTVGAEALLRWHHPERGMVSPAEFIPLAEDSGLILPIGEWVLLSACRLVRRLQQEGGAGQLSRIAVNVSPRQFRQASFVDNVAAILRETGVAASSLELELTEGILVQDMEDTVDKMSALQRLGIRFAIDDFGTGYSSLAYLRQLPLHKLKVDQSFVRAIGATSSGDVLVDTIIAMGKHLNLKVIAEGVETPAQFQQLCTMGCDQFQGYYFSRPLDEEAFCLLLQQAGGSHHCTEFVS